MKEQYEMIKAINRLEEKVNSVNAKIDLLLKSPFRNLLLDTNAVCKLLDISPRTLFELRKEGLIPFIKRSRKVQYAASDVLKYLRHNRIEPEKAVICDKTNPENHSSQ